MKPPYPHLFAAAAALAACAGCFGGESLGNHPGAGGSGGTSPTGGVGGDVGGTSGGIGGTIGAGGGPFCGSFTMPIQPPLSDVLILMDRSSSMNDDSNEMTCTGGCGATSKWSLLADAVENLVAENPLVNWGLALYGSDNQCGVSARATVPVAANNGQAIAAVLAQTTPGGEAPTSSAVTAAVSTLQASYDAYPKYILLVTDGQSGCAGSDDSGTPDATAEAAISLARTKFGIPTFVLGLAPSGDSTAIATLNQMAENGGELSPGTANAFHTISDLGPSFVPVVSPGSCVMPLPYPLDPPATLSVSATSTSGSEVEVPLDTSNGWSFTASTADAIELNGTYCSDLLDGAYASYTLYYGCEMPAHP